MTNMDYSKARDWIISESKFDSSLLGKCEAIMCLGNGYMGLRSSTEEKYVDEKRNLFIAGTFNKFDKSEVTELPNAADLTAVELLINDNKFTLEQGEIKHYERRLNLKTGELSRKILWVSPGGDEVLLQFYRFISLRYLHDIGQKIVITSKNSKISIKINSGIDGRMTNSGSQHFTEGDKRFYDKKYMQYIQTTTESKIDFVHNTTHIFQIDEKESEVKSHIFMDRRKIYSTFETELELGQTLTIQKLSNVYTTRDLVNEGLSLKEIQNISFMKLKKSVASGYDVLLKESSDEWQRQVWKRNPIIIESTEEYDQLAIRFAQYHLTIMTPSHDNRMNIAAKGLSGEGYKGHTFWDTEIFALPYFIFTNPENARKLEEYRYLSLGGARKKAKENQYVGAQFPWESAWLDDGEVTPVWGAADIITGLPTKIWSGFIEQHITADVAFGIWQYYMVTNDQEFMDLYGYELMLDTAKFWVSRLEYSEEDKLYHINGVVGPDEYKEHVDDNAFTNYMAYWNIKKAMEYYHFLKEEKPEIHTKLCMKMDLEFTYNIWVDRIDFIYLPQPRESDYVIAQDKTYLTLEDIELKKYKNQESVGTIFKDYSLEQVNKIKVSKQADIMILFYLLEDLFSQDVKRANWNYYEPRTLHDSSLSLSTHCILANDMGDYEMGYQMFQRASRIDLGENMKTSDDGIHSGSIGGIWQSIVFGFGGVRMIDGKLRINPALPKHWNSLQYMIIWRGQELMIHSSKNKLYIKNATGNDNVYLSVYGKEYCIDNELSIDI